MNSSKRYHPLIIGFEIIKLVKNSAFFAFFFFVIKANSQSTFIHYGRKLFLPIMILFAISIVIKWFTTKYATDNTFLYLSKGLLVRTKRTIPFTKIQNIRKSTTVLHRLFGVTSMTLETGMDGSDSSIEFKVITSKEAAQLEKSISTAVNIEVSNTEKMKEKIIHFSPKKKDLVKAFYTSLSFLVPITVMFTIYTKVSDFINLERWGTDFFLKGLLDSWKLQVAAFIVFFVLSVAIGLLWTYLKYGKYEISSDDSRIYIKKGFLEETLFTISKNRVQAIEIKQSVMKRLTGVAEVSLASTGEVKEADEKDGLNSLFPFVPVEEAHRLAKEILPEYKIEQGMFPLPKESLWVSLLKPSWIWLISTAALTYFQPELFGFKHAWLVVPIALMVVIVFCRVVSFKHARYLFNGPFIQLRTGILGTHLFISKRSKVIEAEVTTTRLQRSFGLASIQIVNRGNPVQYSGIENIPSEAASAFYSWYKGRRNEVTIK